MKESKIRYDIAFSDEKSIGRVSMHKLWDTLKVLPSIWLVESRQISISNGCSESKRF